MIIWRYLVREIAKSLLAVLSVLVTLFAAYSSARLLSHAANGLLPTRVIAESVGLECLIALDVLVPISLYVAVVLVFSRLSSGSEITAMLALRVGPRRVIGAVLVISSVVALAVGELSLGARPWAYGRLHRLSDIAAASLDTSAMHAGTFYVTQHGDRVVFIERREGRGAPGRRVFVRLRSRDGMRIIYAMRADRIPPKTPNGVAEIRLLDAHVYDISDGAHGQDRAARVGAILLEPLRKNVAPLPYSPLAASSVHLARSHAAGDIAEFQWRLTTPISTLLLAILGMLLGRADPRRGPSLRTGGAIAIYFGYYILCNATRIWVQNGVIRPFPGLWWMPLVLAAGLILTFCAPLVDRRWRLL